MDGEANVGQAARLCRLLGLVLLCNKSGNLVHRGHADDLALLQVLDHLVGALLDRAQHHGLGRIVVHLLPGSAQQVVDLALVRAVVALELLQRGDIERDDLGDAAQPFLLGTALDESAGLVFQVTEEAAGFGVGVAHRGVQLAQTLVCLDVITQLRGGRQDLPERLDILVVLKERLASLRVNEAAVNDLLQLLVRALLGVDLQIVFARGDAVGLWPHGASARPGGAAPVPTTIYNAPGSLVRVSLATTTTGRQVQVIGRDLCVRRGARSAAKTADQVLPIGPGSEGVDCPEWR